MEKNEKKPGISIWILMSPLYLLLLIPLYKIAVKNNSNDLNVDKNAFAVDAEVNKRSSKSNYQPMLNNAGGYHVDYASADEETRWGMTEGWLLERLSNLANDPDFPNIVQELYNSEKMINGFMSREDARYYLESSYNISTLLSNKKNVRDFIKEPGIQGLLKNGQALEALLDSKFTDALLSAEASQEFMKDEETVLKILKGNPQLVSILKMPKIRKFIANNEKTGNLATILGVK